MMLMMVVMVMMYGDLQEVSSFGFGINVIFGRSGIWEGDRVSRLIL